MALVNGSQLKLYVYYAKQNDIFILCIVLITCKTETH